MGFGSSDARGFATRVVRLRLGLSGAQIVFFFQVTGVWIDGGEKRCDMKTGKTKQKGCESKCQTDCTVRGCGQGLAFGF